MTCLTCPSCGYEVRPPPEEFLAVGNLAMNTAHSMAYADGLIRLPRKQGLLLAALMRDAGRPLPRAHLMDASDIWGAPHTLVVYICELRRLVGHVAEIRTHPGSYSIHPRDEEIMTEKRAPSGASARYVPEPGEKYHAWTVLRVLGRNAKGVLITEVQCECGKRFERVFSAIRRGEGKSCGCRGRKRRKAVNGGFYLGGVLHRHADGSGPRLVHGAVPTPGGTLLDEDVVRHMREHGVTKVVRAEL